MTIGATAKHKGHFHGKPCVPPQALSIPVDAPITLMSMHILLLEPHIAYHAHFHVLELTLHICICLLTFIHSTTTS